MDFIRMRVAARRTLTPHITEFTLAPVEGAGARARCPISPWSAYYG